MRVSDKDIEHALMPSSGLRMGKSTLHKAMMDLRDARQENELLKVRLQSLAMAVLQSSLYRIDSDIQCAVDAALEVAK